MAAEWINDWGPGLPAYDAWARSQGRWGASTPNTIRAAEEHLAREEPDSRFGQKQQEVKKPVVEEPGAKRGPAPLPGLTRPANIPENSEIFQQVYELLQQGKNIEPLVGEIAAERQEPLSERQQRRQKFLSRNKDSLARAVASGRGGFRGEGRIPRRKKDK